MVPFRVGIHPKCADHTGPLRMAGAAFFGALVAGAVAGSRSVRGSVAHCGGAHPVPEAAGVYFVQTCT